MSLLAELRRPALIRGHGHERICIVITSKDGVAAEPARSQLFRPPIKIADSKDDFEDGNYELVLGAQVFALRKSGGNYKEISEPSEP